LHLVAAAAGAGIGVRVVVVVVDGDAVGPISSKDVAGAGGGAADEVVRGEVADVHPGLRVAQGRSAVGAGAGVVPFDDVAGGAAAEEDPRVERIDHAVGGNDVAVRRRRSPDEVVGRAVDDQHATAAVRLGDRAGAIGADVVAGEDVAGGAGA